MPWLFENLEVSKGYWISTKSNSNGVYNSDGYNVYLQSISVYNGYIHGVRPVITIPKSSISN